MAFNRKQYMKEWNRKHRSRCRDCDLLIKFNSLRCKPCESKNRWKLKTARIGNIENNSGSFKKPMPKDSKWGKTFLRRRVD